MHLVDNEKFIQTLFANSAYPAFGESIGIRRVKRRMDDMNMLGVEYRVKGWHELSIIRLMWNRIGKKRNDTQNREYPYTSIGIIPMTSIELNTLLTTLYVLVDDWYQARGQLLLAGKAGAKPRFSDSERLTLLLAHDFVP